ncbi:MAG TPA: hypothetical protein VE619_03750 [Nitrososphaeraceae archaeon]|nr:hypothetical protein [Nitrososphaeraceae archaeon]
MEHSKNKTLKLLPKIKKEQVPNDNGTSIEILYGSSNHDKTIK